METPAQVLLPAPDESPLLTLLVTAGMPHGYAASALRALLEAGITSLDCPALEALDEFDLGRIVGSRSKGQVIRAFREAGWRPPKERKVAPPKDVKLSTAASGLSGFLTKRTPQQDKSYGNP